LKLSLCKVEYKVKDDNPVIYLFCRDSNNQRHVIPVYSFTPYFYATREMSRRISEVFKVNRIPTTLRCLTRGVKVDRIEVGIPEQVRTIVDHYRNNPSDILQIFEADVLFVLRFMIDKGIFSGVEADTEANVFIAPADSPSRLRVWYLDIEAYTMEIEELATGSSEVIIIGFEDTFVNKLYLLTTKELDTRRLEECLVTKKPIEIIQCYNERDLLGKFISLISSLDPDVIITYSHFDMRHIFHRMEHYNLPKWKMSKINSVYLRRRERDEGRLIIKGRSVLDLSEMYRIALETPRFESLEALAERHLEYGRIYHKESVVDNWDNDPTKVAMRNLRDVEITRDLDISLGLLDRFDELRKLVGCNIEDTFYPSRIADIMYLRKAHNRVVLPTKSPHKKVPYKGAVVKKVEAGIYHNVLVLDFKSMYPNIMITFNISYETIIKDFSLDGLEIDGLYKYSTLERGLACEILEDLFPVKVEIEKEMKAAKYKKDWDKYSELEKKKLAIKAIINGVYGYFSFSGDYAERIPASRLYYPKISESIAYIGRVLQTECMFPYAESMGYKVIAADTDSVFVLLQSDNPEEEARVLKDKFDRRLKEFARERWNIDAELLTVDIDKIFSRLIIKTKKRYAGRTIEGRYEYKGLEVVRKDQADITIDVEKEVLRRILDDQPREEIRKYMKSIIRNFKSYPLKYICPTVRLTKDTRVYKSSPASLKAYLYSTKVLNLSIPEYRRFYLLYVKKIPEGYPDKITIVRQNAVVEKEVNAIAFLEVDDIPKGFCPNYKKLLELTLKDKLEDILELLDLKWSEVEGVSLVDYI